MAHVKRISAGAALLGIALVSEYAAAAVCTAGTRASPCFDADTLWIPPAPSRFASIARSAAMPGRTYSLGLAFVYLSQPVTLKALAPDPNGRKVLVVDDVVGASVAASYSPIRHLELGAVLPMNLYRTGTGLTGVTSQSGSSLSGATLRDIRIGAGHDLVLRPSPAGHVRFTAMARFELALPTGNEEAFAGNRTVVAAPSFSFGVRINRVLLAAQEGARFRNGVDFGGARIATELVSSLGATVDVVPKGLFSLSGEFWFLPNFLSTKNTEPDGTVRTSTLVPAEWLATAWTRLSDVLLGVGGGTALPLSSETRTEPTGAESAEVFAGVTTPRFRLFLSARYAPRDAD
jgi:hypothetical protein